VTDAPMIVSLTLPLPRAELVASNADPELRVTASARALRVRRRLPSAGTREWLLDLEVELPDIDPEDLLARCDGFLVDGRDGSEIGIVEEVETSGPASRVSALIVSSGWFGRRRYRLDADDVAAVIPAERRIVIGDPPAAGERRS
jgi:hypothetical protein